MPLDPTELTRSDGVMFAAPSGWQPAAEASVVQGALEESNVNAVAQITRMIEVQRAYELGQGFLDREDQRIRSVIQAVGR